MLSKGKVYVTEGNRLVLISRYCHEEDMFVDTYNDKWNPDGTGVDTTDDIVREANVRTLVQDLTEGTYALGTEYTNGAIGRMRLISVDFGDKLMLMVQDCHSSSISSTEHMGSWYRVTGEDKCNE